MGKERQAMTRDALNRISRKGKIFRRVGFLVIIAGIVFKMLGLSELLGPMAAVGFLMCTYGENCGGWVDGYTFAKQERSE